MMLVSIIIIVVMKSHALIVTMTKIRMSKSICFSWAISYWYARVTPWRMSWFINERKTSDCRMLAVTEWLDGLENWRIYLFRTLGESLTRNLEKNLYANLYNKIYIFINLFKCFNNSFNLKLILKYTSLMSKWQRLWYLKLVLAFGI